MYPITAGLIVESKELWGEVKSALAPLPIRLAFEASEVPQDWGPFLERLDRMQPDVILLEITKLREHWKDVLENGPVDQNGKRYGMPIEKAKEELLKQGLPARNQ